VIQSALSCDRASADLISVAIATDFAQWKITPTIHTFDGGEVNKNMDTMLGFVDAMDKFGELRRFDYFRKITAKFD
jgi:hypothetical protein